MDPTYLRYVQFAVSAFGIPWLFQHLGYFQFDVSTFGICFNVWGSLGFRMLRSTMNDVGTSRIRGASSNDGGTFQVILFLFITLKPGFE